MVLCTRGRAFLMVVHTIGRLIGTGRGLITISVGQIASATPVSTLLPATCSTLFRTASHRAIWYAQARAPLAMHGH